MRIDSGKPCANGGYLHALDASPQKLPPRPNVEAPPKINVTQIMHEWREKTQPEWIAKLGLQLGVSAVALASLGCAWSALHRAWAWPMYDGYYEPVGIRLRTSEGKKFAVTGSHQGLFLPATKPGRELMICEGPTDTSAALSVGMFAIGRPSCLGCEGFVNDFIRTAGVTRVIVCADADTPGQNGADKLQSALSVPSIIWTPCAKDIRDAVRNGLTAPIITAMTKDLLWKQPNKRP